MEFWCRCWCRFGVDVGVELPAAPTPRRALLRLTVPGRAHPRVELARVEAARRSAPRRPRSACLCGPRRPPAYAAGMKVDGGGALAVDGERALGGQRRRQVHRLLLLLVSAQGSRAVEAGACDFDWDRFGGEAEVRTGPTCKDLGPHGRAFDGRKCLREVISEHSVEVGGKN
jgi:hypothetical protein